jgi:hypothetical protein
MTAPSAFAQILVSRQTATIRIRSMHLRKTPVEWQEDGSYVGQYVRRCETPCQRQIPFRNRSVSWWPHCGRAGRTPLSSVNRSTSSPRCTSTAASTRLA